jgi:hypothetical protein
MTQAPRPGAARRGRRHGQYLCVREQRKDISGTEQQAARLTIWRVQGQIQFLARRFETAHWPAPFSWHRLPSLVRRAHHPTSAGPRCPVLARQAMSSLMARPGVQQPGPALSIKAGLDAGEVAGGRLQLAGPVAPQGSRRGPRAKGKGRLSPGSRPNAATSGWPTSPRREMSWKARAIRVHAHAELATIWRLSGQTGAAFPACECSSSPNGASSSRHESAFRGRSCQCHNDPGRHPWEAKAGAAADEAGQLLCPA